MKIENLLELDFEYLAEKNKNPKWDSNPRPKIYGPTELSGLNRSLRECQPKLFSALNSIFGVVVDVTVLGNLQQGLLCPPYMSVVNGPKISILN